jgi:hypothetical protein
MLKDTLSEKESKQLQRLMKTEPVKEEHFMFPATAKTLLSKKLIKKDKDGEFWVNWENLATLK